jgi:biotin synthase
MKSRPFERLQEIYSQPFFDLIQQGRAVYLENWPNNEVQLCTLLSIKTGGCSEDCAYCSQSARYETGLETERLLSTPEVLEVARRAKSNGSTRFCMGAAWKGVREGTQAFDSVLETVREVSKLGMEVCVTLGQLTDVAAQQLKEAGVTAYNHNLDTSPEFYPQIVTTHTFQDRLDTIRAVQNAGMSVCSGGIIGMGETIDDRLHMLEVLANFDPPPESVPINCLMTMPGTPLEDQPPVDVFELVRLIATTRIAAPTPFSMATNSSPHKIPRPTPTTSCCKSWGLSPNPHFPILPRPPKKWRSVRRPLGCRYSLAKRTRIVFSALSTQSARRTVVTTETTLGEFGFVSQKSMFLGAFSPLAEDSDRSVRRHICA